jgi:PKD repeat protein
MAAAVIACLVASSAIAVKPTVLTAFTTQSGLRIVVISGEDAVNIIQQKTAVTPVVEVRDRNDLPVAGAIVTFSIAGGKGAAFGGASTLTVTTNAAGQAAAAGFSPATAGAIQINVQAAFQGQVAAATIAQTNVLTAAEAAAAASGTGGTGGGSSAGGAAGGGGGGLSATTIGIIAGAVGAGALVATQVAGGNAAPVAGGVTVTPAIALMASDNVSFSVQVSDQDNDPLTYQWNFGDGATSTEAVPRHVYNSTGTFNVQVAVSDGKDTANATATVTVRSLTGTWLSDTIQSGGFGPVNVTMILSQNGTTVTGTNPVIVGPTGSGGPGALSGSVRTVAPRLTLNWVLSNDGVPGRTGNYQMNLDPSSDLNTLTGSVGGPQGVFRRQ